MHDWTFPGVAGFAGTVSMNAEVVVVAVCRRCGTIRDVAIGVSYPDERSLDLSGECEAEGDSAQN